MWNVNFKEAYWSSINRFPSVCMCFEAYYLSVLIWIKCSVTFSISYVCLLYVNSILCLFSEQLSHRSANTAQDVSCGVAASETQQDDSLQVWCPLLWLSILHKMSLIKWKEKRSFILVSYFYLYKKSKSLCGSHRCDGIHSADIYVSMF